MAMKRFLANVVGGIGYVLLELYDHSYPLFIRLVNFLYWAAYESTSRLVHFLVEAIDEGVMRETEEKMELQKQRTELSLLDSISKIRDNALANKEWTDSHTEAVNSAGSALANECDWEIDAVNAYIKEVVESIDGLECTFGDDD